MANDPNNTLVLETTKGRVVIRLRPDLAPKHVERIPDIFRAVRSCWRFSPPERGPSGQQLTLRLSFKRDGQVLGRPQITYYQPGGDREAQEDFRRSVMQAFQRCLPLPLSNALGSAIAGRPFTFRFIDDRAL